MCRVFKWVNLYCVLVVEMSQELKHSSCLDLLQQILVSLKYSSEENRKGKNYLLAYIFIVVGSRDYG